MIRILQTHDKRIQLIQQLSVIEAWDFDKFSGIADACTNQELDNIYISTLNCEGNRIPFLGGFFISIFTSQILLLVLLELVTVFINRQIFNQSDLIIGFIALYLQYLQLYHILVFLQLIYHLLKLIFSRAWVTS